MFLVTAPRFANASQYRKTASPSMTVTPPPVETQHKKQQRCAESFASVDFEGVRESFDTTATARMLGASMAAIVPLLSGVAEAGAKGGEFGIIEGKTASFLHPIIMVQKNNEAFEESICFLYYFLYINRNLASKGLG